MKLRTQPQNENGDKGVKFCNHFLFIPKNSSNLKKYLRILKVPP